MRVERPVDDLGNQVRGRVEDVLVRRRPSREGLGSGCVHVATIYRCLNDETTL